MDKTKPILASLFCIILLSGCLNPAEMDAFKESIGLRKPRYRGRPDTRTQAQIIAEQEEREKIIAQNLENDRRALEERDQQLVERQADHKEQLEALDARLAKRAPEVAKLADDCNRLAKSSLDSDKAQLKSMLSEEMSLLKGYKSIPWFVNSSVVGAFFGGSSVASPYTFHDPQYFLNVTGFGGYSASMMTELKVGNASYIFFLGKLVMVQYRPPEKANGLEIIDALRIKYGNGKLQKTPTSKTSAELQALAMMAGAYGISGVEYVIRNNMINVVASGQSEDTSKLASNLGMSSEMLKANGYNDSTTISVIYYYTDLTSDLVREAVNSSIDARKKAEEERRQQRVNSLSQEL